MIPKFLKKVYLVVKNLRKTLIPILQQQQQIKLDHLMLLLQEILNLKISILLIVIKITGQGNSPVGFASGEASVKLEENNGITKLIYSVEANVGGKIAQVGSRLIDMTAKKMADIFFGKFSELLSSAEKKEDKKEDIKTVSEKSFNLKQINKKLLYATVVVVVLLAIYLLK